MNQNQFSGEDSQLARDLVTDQQSLLETRFVLKRRISTSGGNVALGVAPTSAFVLIECAGQKSILTGKDIQSGGGLYQIGDISVTSQIPVFGPDNKNKTTVDTLIEDGQTYQLVGRPFPIPMAGGTTFTKSVWRRQE